VVGGCVVVVLVEEVLVEVVLVEVALVEVALVVDVVAVAAPGVDVHEAATTARTATMIGTRIRATLTHPTRPVPAPLLELKFCVQGCSPRT
jgi:hypothetical protein